MGLLDELKKLQDRRRELNKEIARQPLKDVQSLVKEREKVIKEIDELYQKMEDALPEQEKVKMALQRRAADKMREREEERKLAEEYKYDFEVGVGKWLLWLGTVVIFIGVAVGTVLLFMNLLAGFGTILSGVVWGLGLIGLSAIILLLFKILSTLRK